MNKPLATTKTNTKTGKDNNPNLDESNTVARQKAQTLGLIQKYAPWWHLDPRLTTALLFILNFSCLWTLSNYVLLPAGIITFSCMLLECSPRQIITWLSLILLFGGMDSLGLFLAKGSPWLWLGLVGYWCLRFTISFGFAIYFFTSIRADEAATALIQTHAPYFLYVPIMVVIRFFPVAFQELQAITDAMKLRGLNTRKQIFLHPLKLGEQLLVPFLASASRIADELAAAAIIKGLDGKNKPTHLAILRFKFIDYIYAILALCLLVANIIIGEIK